MSDWALGKKLNSRIADVPLNHLIWLNDYKTYGTASYVWQDRRIWFELMESPCAINDGHVIQTCLAHFITCGLPIKNFLKNLYGTPTSVLSAISENDSFEQALLRDNYKTVFPGFEKWWTLLTTNIYAIGPMLKHRPYLVSNGVLHTALPTDCSNEFAYKTIMMRLVDWRKDTSNKYVNFVRTNVVDEIVSKYNISKMTVTPGYQTHVPSSTDNPGAIIVNTTHQNQMYVGHNAYCKWYGGATIYNGAAVYVDSHALPLFTSGYGVYANTSGATVEYYDIPDVITNSTS